MRLWRRLVDRWDFLVYRLAYDSLQRMCKRREGWAYLIEMSLRDWREQHPLDPMVQRSAERFHEANRRYAERNRAHSP